MDVESLIIFSIFWVFMEVLLMRQEKFSFGSKVKPRMVGLEGVGMGCC